MRKFLLAAGVALLGAFSAQAQCEEWVYPSPTTAWGDLAYIGCEGWSIEIDEFEVYASEAYSLNGIEAGYEIKFSNCNGPGAGSWQNEYTIIAPSGAVDAFGASDGDGCSITWTASESGVYTIVISEAGNCGVDNAIGNGYPSVEVIVGKDCPVFIPGAESFEGDGLPDGWTSMDADEDGYDWNTIDLTDSDDRQAIDGDYVIRSESFDGVEQLTLEPDNYLITPQVTVGEEDSLYYAISAIDQDFAAEHYSVLVSTSGTDLVDFTDEIFSETLASTRWDYRSIDLSAYSGQDIYIAFRHHDVTNEFWFMMDAVALPPIATNVEERAELKDITLFPNPSNGLFSVSNGGTTELYQIRVFDVTGKEVFADQVVLSSGAQYSIDLSDASSGIYTVQMVSPTQAGALRVVKN